MTGRSGSQRVEVKRGRLPEVSVGDRRGIHWMSQPFQWRVAIEDQ